MLNGVNVNNNTQTAFKAKKPNRKEIYEFIDKSNDLVFDLLNKDRPIEEQREIAIRRALTALKKCPFVGKIMKLSETTVEHTIPEDNKLIELVDDSNRQAYLAEIRRRNPELFKEVLRRDEEYKVAQMTNMQIIKEFIKSLFK